MQSLLLDTKWITAGTNDSLKIRYQNEADTINFQCEGSDDRLADFDLKLMQIESG